MIAVCQNIHFCLICYLSVTARVEVESVGHDFNPVADMRVLDRLQV